MLPLISFVSLISHYLFLRVGQKTKKSQFYFYIYKEHFPKVSKKSQLILITPKDKVNPKLLVNNYRFFFVNSLYNQSYWEINVIESQNWNGIISGRTEYRQTGTKTDDRQKDRNNRQKTIPKVFPGNKCRNVCLVKIHHLFFMIVYGRMYGMLLHRYYPAL